MIWPFNIARRRAQHAEAEAVRAEAELENTERRWPEVNAVSSWARERRERNHLTELFLQELRGSNGNG